MPAAGLKGSRYNIAVRPKDKDHVLLFNSATRGLLQVDEATFANLAPLFFDGRRGIPVDHHIDVPEGLDDQLISVLSENGFLVPEPRDEIAELRAAYERERHNEALYYIIGMTMACNFDCPYCFEEHLPVHMDLRTADAVHDFVVDQARQAKAKSLMISWFGGEPLLAADVLVHLSGRLRDSCAELGVSYVSYVITNGALLDPECAARLAAAGVVRAQVTIDGPRDIHDKRRYFRGGQRSFDRILSNLLAIKEILPVMVRVNTDEGNVAHIGELVQVLREAGLFAEPNPIQFYASAVVPYTDQARILWKPLGAREASSLDLVTLSALKEAAVSEEHSVRSDSLLKPTRGGCAAMQHHSFTIGPRGHLFKCEIGIHDEREAVGTVFGATSAPPLQPTKTRRLPILNASGGVGSKALPWTDYNPFDNEKCKTCQFVPFCKSGCPKRHLEHDEPFMAAICNHWDTNFTRLLEEAATDRM